MKRLFSLFLMLFPFYGVGQDWQWVSCDQLPVTNLGCAIGGSFAELSPNTDPQLFSINVEDTTNCWVYGESSKNFLNSSLPLEGWVTDSINNYETNLNSEFVVSVPHNEISYGVTWISFEHKYETDSLKDGGYLLFSCDSNTWNDVYSGGWSNPPEIIHTENYHTSLIQGTTQAFTGSSSDWITSSVSIMWYVPVFHEDETRGGNGCDWESMDTIYFKFVFESDSIQNEKGGWMIRNITVGAYGLGGNITDQSQQLLLINPNPTTSTLQIQLPENNVKAIRTRIYDMTGRLVRQETFNPDIDVSELDFGQYVIVVETEKGFLRSRFQKN